RMAMDTEREDGWGDFTDLNRAYLLDVFDRYRSDADSVDPETRELFTRIGPPPESGDETARISEPASTPVPSAVPGAVGAGLGKPAQRGARVRLEPLARLDSAPPAVDPRQVAGAAALAAAIRGYGYRAARLDPLGS